MNNPFLKYVMKDEKEDIFHSSAYGKAQNGQGIGTASVETFTHRNAINNNRQHVKSYGDSEIINSTKMNAPHAKTYTPPARTKTTPTPVQRPIIPKNPGISR